MSEPDPSVTAEGTNAQTAPVLIEGCLIYATQNSMPPAATYRPVDPELRAKLKNMPLRWTNQFVVSKTRLRAPWTVEQTRSLSTNYQIRIRCLNGDKFDLTVLRQGKMVIRRTQRITKDEICVVGGDFPSSPSSWLIVLWQVQ